MLGRIYTIKCSEDPRVYVGSTFKTLDERLHEHVNCSKCEVYKHRPLYLAMNEYGPDKFTMELLEEVDDVDKTILFRIEGMHIEQHIDSLIPLFNQRIAGRDSKQYRESNKEYIKEQKKQWYEDNKEYIRERTKQYYGDNKEYIRERTKQYCEDNKEYIRERTKQYREDNKERLIEYGKQYYEDNKERIKEQNKTTVICECGDAITKYNLARHKRSRKHVKWELSQ